MTVGHPTAERDGVDRHDGGRPGGPIAMDADAWDARYSAQALVWSTEPNRFVEQVCSALPVGSAVDLGCGEGRNATWLARRGWQVEGVDFSPVAIAKSRALAEAAGALVSWTVADALQWAGGGCADLVLIAYLHLPTVQRAELILRAAAQVAPGGSLVLVGHDLRNLTEGVGGPQDPDLLWTPSEVDLPGWSVHVRATAPRPVGDATAWDTLVHLSRAN